MIARIKRVSVCEKCAAAVAVALCLVRLSLVAEIVVTAFCNRENFAAFFHVEPKIPARLEATSVKFTKKKKKIENKAMEI